LAYALSTIKRVRLIRRADGYFCQFCIAVCRVVHHKPSGTQRGIDVGINAYYTDSAGTKVENPRYVKQAEERLSYWHREVSRKGIRYKKQKKPKASKKQNTYPKGHPVVKVARVPEKHWHNPATTNQTLRRTQRRQRPHHPPPPPPPNQNIPPPKGNNPTIIRKRRSIWRTRICIFSGSARIMPARRHARLSRLAT